MTQHEISTILQAIARLEVKVDGLIDDNADVETRLRGLEKTRYLIAGFALAFGASGGALAGRIIGA